MGGGEEEGKASYKLLNLPSRPVKRRFFGRVLDYFLLTRPKQGKGRRRGLHNLHFRGPVAWMDKLVRKKGGKERLMPPSLSRLSERMQKGGKKGGLYNHFVHRVD